MFSKFKLEGPPSSHCGISFKLFPFSHRPCNFSLKKEWLRLEGKEVERVNEESQQMLLATPSCFFQLLKAQDDLWMDYGLCPFAPIHPILSRFAPFPIKANQN